MVIDETELEGLTEDQRDAYIALKEGRNVFLSGNAGTGKSYVLNRFIDDLEARSVPYTAMAPTGIAALNMHNGSTIHRTLQVSAGVCNPSEKIRPRKVLTVAEVIIIHKSQGLTFDRCTVHTKTFAAGQLYVGLSRCSNIEGLTIFPKMEKNRLHASREVIDFYARMEKKAREGTVQLECPQRFSEQVKAYIADLLEKEKAAEKQAASVSSAAGEALPWEREDAPGRDYQSTWNQF